MLNCPIIGLRFLLPLSTSGKSISIIYKYLNMKKLYLIRLLWVAMFFGAFNANAAVRYVNGSVTISGDGNSWDSPYKTLQEAITAASSGDEIWVAAGTYQPANEQSFAMKEGVKIYGGFAGTENSLAQRNWKTNVSELMGNQASVVINDGNGLTSAALLDGFKISSGYATAGGGMYNNNASPTISNCIFASNIADEMGGAMYNLNSSPTIVNVVFDSNETELDGAAVYNKDSSPLVMNTIFFENPATRYGGGMFNSGGNVNVINCLFKGNRVWTDGDGAAIYSKSGTTIAVINSIVWGNLLEEETISTFGGDGTTNVSYSIIEGGDSNNGNKNTDPKFVDVVGYKGSDGIWGTADDGLRLSANSPAINAGTNAQYLNLSAATTDVSGKPRVYDFANNGVIDMGAYEYQGVLVFPAADGTVYVKKGSTGNGTSWADAVGELAHALKTAKTVPAIKQIWVAAGTYTPLFSPADDNFGDDAGRANAFLLVRNVQVYGGFAGTETSLSQRDFYANVSTLSGDLGAFGKSYNVVISSGPIGLATLDGFTIRDGDASNSSYFYVNGNQVYPCSGAGIYNSVSDAFYNNLIVMNNSSGESGGGMFSYRSSVRLSNVTMKNNSARHGGAMANQDNSHAMVINSLFIGNSSSDGGDAIYNVDGSLPKFVNITVAKNSGSAKNGILNENNAEPKVYNSIVWGGIDGDYQAENSIIQHSADATNGNIDASSLDDIDIFKNPANNEFSLKSASPAINKGNNALYQTPDGVNNTSLTNDKDLEGNPRVYNLVTGGTIDLGAYEYQGAYVLSDAAGIVYVKKGSTGSGASWANALGELADALKDAKTNTAIKQIWVAAGTYHPLYSPADNNFGTSAGRDNSFLMVKDVKVYGGFAGMESSISQRIAGNVLNRSILSGDVGVVGDKADNVYHVAVSTADVGTAIFDGFTLTAGTANGGGEFTVNNHVVARDAGGGMFIRLSSPTLSNCIFTDNVANGAGGAIFNRENASPIISLSSFVNNTAGLSGGAIYNENQSSPNIDNTTFSGNASTNHGGAIYSYYYSSPTLTNCVFTNNTATNQGSVMYNNADSSPKLINTTIAKNGSDAINGNSTVVVQNSIVWDDITSAYTASNSLIKGLNPTGVANINATNLNVSDVFVNYTSGNFELKTTSPAIAAGSNSLFNGLTETTKDLAGNARVYRLTDGGTIDLGAYEYQGTLSQTISFAALDPKTTNSADFTLGATASSGLAVSYTSSNTAIAEVYQDNSVWKVKIKAAGSVDITAQQVGNGDYAAATAVDQTLVIADGTLPVQLTNYTAKVVNQTARLDWSVSSERDNRKFVIYRSGDDNQFAEIGGVASLGNTSTNRNYFFVDKQPLNGNNYYKLVQVDLDGKPTELGVKPLNFILSAVHVSVYPNPTKEKVNVTFEAGKYNRAALSSIEGKVLKSFELSAQHDQLAIDLSAYSIGTYFIRLTGAQQSIVKKVVKQ